MQMGENHAFGLLHIACGKNSNTAVQFFKSSRAVLKTSTFTAYSPLGDTALGVNAHFFLLLPSM